MYVLPELDNLDLMMQEMGPDHHTGESEGLYWTRTPSAEFRRTQPSPASGITLVTIACVDRLPYNTKQGWRESVIASSIKSQAALFGKHYRGTPSAASQRGSVGQA